jgi:thiamine-phosphate diphosphorylase
MKPFFSSGKGGADIDARAAHRGESGIDGPSAAAAGDGVATVVVAPDGRTTRFFWDTRPNQSAGGALSSARDVVIHTGTAESAVALYGAYQDAVSSSPCRAGKIAVIDVSEPGRLRLLRDGWGFLYVSPRGDDDAWLDRCAAFVEGGYALHDTLCLALARIVATDRCRPINAMAPAEQADPATASDLASPGDARSPALPPLSAFPEVYAPWRIPGRPIEECAAESAFDEMAAVALNPVSSGDDPTEQCIAGASLADNGLARDASALSRVSGVLPTFPRCADALGLYPIAPNADWVGRLVEAGARTVQLRIKTATAPTAVGTAQNQATDQATDQAALREEIRRAVAYCREASRPVQLFINDHWHLAIEAGAYGVHLGQEDLAALPDFALGAIASAGLRLGLSTHGYYEMLLALRFRPSYIACGPIFATKTKVVTASPQGLLRLAAYCRLLQDAVPPMPVVAIGGLGLAQLAAVRAAGAASAAVVGALVNRANETDRNALRKAVSALQDAFNG